MELPLWAHVVRTIPEQRFARTMWSVMVIFKIASLLLWVLVKSPVKPATITRMTKTAWACVFLFLYGTPMAFGLLFVPETILTQLEGVRRVSIGLILRVLEPIDQEHLF
jgi:hypothetical protein